MNNYHLIIKTVPITILCIFVLCIITYIPLHPTTNIDVNIQNENNPEITIHRPTDEFEYTWIPGEIWEPPRFNITVNFHNTPDSVYMIFHESKLNIVVNNTISEIQNFTNDDLTDDAIEEYQDIWNEIDEGQYTMMFYANNTAGGESTENVTIYKVIGEPSDIDETLGFLNRLFSDPIGFIISIIQWIITILMSIIGLGIYCIWRKEKKHIRQNCPCIDENDCWCDR